MGIFYHRSIKNYQGSKYLSLKPNRIANFSYLPLVILMALSVPFLTAYNSQALVIPFFILMGIIFLGAIVAMIETSPILFARIRGLPVIRRGGFTIFNSQNPPEFLIKQ